MADAWPGGRGVMEGRGGCGCDGSVGKNDRKMER